MRIFKPTYSKPLPEGAKTFECKGKMFAKFKDAKGHTTQARLTKDKSNILLEVEHWHIEFEDGQRIRRRVKAFTEEQATKRLTDTIKELLNCKYNNQQPSEDLSKRFEVLPAEIRNDLIQFGLIDTQRATIGKPLTEHIREFGEYLQKKERSAAHVKEVVGILTKVFEKCGFVTWSGISAAKLKNYLDGKRDSGKGIGKRR